MTGRIDGKVAVITGGGDGIGRGIARRFAKEGAKLLLAEINPETGQAVTSELRDVGADIEFLRTDVTQKDQVLAMIERAIERFGRIDILVNNAWGGGSLKKFENKTDADLDHGLKMAVWASFWAMQAAFPHMRRQGWGRIINMCSLNGVNAHRGTLEYNVGKEALRSMSRTAAREWAHHGIAVNVIAPGAYTSSSKRVMEEHPEVFERMAGAFPGAKGGMPEDIANVAIFLASDDCGYMVGNTLYVDGGGHINGVDWNPDLPD